MRRIIRVVLIAAIAGAMGAAAQERPIPALGEGTRPWLLYTASDGVSSTNHLMVAWMVENEVKTEEIIAAPYIAVEPLTGGHVLLSAGPSAAESQRYAVNLETGEKLLLSERSGHDPIAFKRPGERMAVHTPSSTAFLIQDADGAEDLEFLSVKYRDMTVDVKTLDKSLFATSFDDGIRMYVAPDGKHIAFFEGATAPEDTERVLRYRLKVYHFSNGSVNSVDDEVFIQYSKKATAPALWPAAAWFDNTHVVYTHSNPQIAGGPDQTLVTFRKVEVEKGGKEVIFDQILPHPRTSPYIVKDRATNNLVLTYPAANTEEFIIVAEATTLVPNPQVAHGMVLKKGAGVVQVLRDDAIIFNKEHFAESVDGMLSRSKLHAAVILSGPGETPEYPSRSELYISLRRGAASRVDTPAAIIDALYWLE